MEHLREQVGITLYEYFCDCGHFFWISHFDSTKMYCPYCGEVAHLNGVLPITDIKFGDENEVQLVGSQYEVNENNKNTVTKI